MHYPCSTQPSGEGAPRAGNADLHVRARLEWPCGRLGYSGGLTQGLCPASFRTVTERDCPGATSAKEATCHVGDISDVVQSLGGEEPLFLPRESHGQRSLVDSIGSQRAGHS